MTYLSVFTDEEWGLLVGLPQSVLRAAAAAAEPEGLRRTLAEGDAGLAVIAAGRESASTLVVAVAEELISRVGDPEEGEHMAMIRSTDPADAVADALDRARAAAGLLDERVDEGDAGAYKHWLVGIAEEVVGVALVSETERRFHDELAGVLGD
jgi:hypothetical protein